MNKQKRFIKALAMLLAMILCISTVSLPVSAHEQGETAEETVGVALESPQPEILPAKEIGDYNDFSPDEDGLVSIPMSMGSTGAIAPLASISGSLVFNLNIRCIESPVSGVTSLGKPNGETLEWQTVKAMYRNGKYTVVYCADHGLDASSGSSYSGNDAEQLSDDTWKIIGDIIANGWQYSGSAFNTSSPFYTQRYKYCATQMMVWAARAGNIYYDKDGVIVFNDCVLKDIEPLAMKCGAYNEYYAYFYELKNKLIALRKIPSFAFRDDKEANRLENTITLPAAGDGTFSATVSDKNKVLERFKFTFADPGLSAAVNGNNLRLTAANELTDAVVSQKATYEIDGGTNAVILWKPPYSSLQRMVECKDNAVDPVSAYIAVQTGEFDEDNPPPDEEVTPQWRVTVTKRDKETGTAQGDATLAGAVYGIYQNGVLLDTYVTNSAGQFTTDWYDCGTGYTLREISASRGYLVNSASISLNTTSAGEEMISLTATATETVIKGKIGITKHTDDGSTQIETPEVGAEFQVYLSASGSYEKAKATERDIITIGDNGYGETKLLPYGTYTVHQTEGWEGKEKIPDFQVLIGEDGKTYSFIINNHVFEALIQIVKKDAETGRVIPASGIGFRIKDLSTGEWVSQHINYPTPMDISIFYTDVTGRLMLPAMLPYGDYELYEQQSAYGYVLSKDPVPFKVDGTAKTVTVEMGNIPQKGTLTIKKQGEVFESVRVSGGKFQPVYETKGLAGAVYGLYADEDIVTPDGTLRYPAGVLIEQMATGKDGTAAFPPVYLGKYIVREITAPFGYVRDTAVYHVEFSYGGQEIALLSETLDCFDQRQKVEISLTKALEQDEIYGIGRNGEYESIRFGLFAAEDIQAADGKVIPKDGPIEEISLNDALAGQFTTDLPFGNYYVREIATDEHYLLTDTVYPVEFSYARQEKAVVKIAVNDGDTIENSLKRGKLLGHKTDEDGLSLPGAVFGLFPVGTTDFSLETALVTTVSRFNGDFIFENIPVGTWLLRELTAPPPFVLSHRVYEVEITEDGQEVLIDAVNRFIKGNVTLTKVDEDYPENKLSGAVFAIYADSDNDLEFTAADVKIGTLEETEPGVYSMENLRWGGYFCVEEKAPKYFVPDDTPRFFEIREDGKTVTIANSGECLVNQPQTGALRIKKSSEDGKVAGILFRVTGLALTGQRYDKLFRTDRHGVIFIPDLRIGRYTVTEVGTENTVQYVLPPDQTTVIRTGEVSTVRFYNRLKRGDIAGQKFGEDGKGLTNVVFGLFPEGTEEFTEESAIATEITDCDGAFFFTKVTYGKYLLKELSTLPGFVLLQEPIPVEITEDGVVIRLGGIVNEHTKVQISKQDITTGKELPGAKLELRTVDGEVLESWTSTDEPHLIERLPLGEYILHEETAPDGYTVAEDVKFTVMETGEIQTVIMQDTPKPVTPNTGEDRTIVYVSGAFVLALIGAYVSAILLRRERRKKQ